MKWKSRKVEKWKSGVCIFHFSTSWLDFSTFPLFHFSKSRPDFSTFPFFQIMCWLFHFSTFPLFHLGDSTFHFSTFLFARAGFSTFPLFQFMRRLGFVHYSLLMLPIPVSMFYVSTFLCLSNRHSAKIDFAFLVKAYAIIPVLICFVWFHLLFTDMSDTKV